MLSFMTLNNYLCWKQHVFWSFFMPCTPPAAHVIAPLYTVCIICGFPISNPRIFCRIHEFARGYPHILCDALSNSQKHQNLLKKIQIKDINWKVRDTEITCNLRISIPSIGFPVRSVWSSRVNLALFKVKIKWILF